MPKHPCADKCPNFIDEQCCHCLIQESQAEPSDEDKHLAHALEAVEYVT